MGTPPDEVRVDPLARFSVHAGAFAEVRSWVYAWFSRPDRAVVYVGATRLPPPVRIWLHLHDPDPDVGRISARLPQAAEEDFEVLAAQVPPHEDRARVRDALIAGLREEGLLSARYVGPQPRDHAEAGGPIAPDLVGAMLDAVRRLQQEDHSDAS